MVDELISVSERTVRSVGAIVTYENFRISHDETPLSYDDENAVYPLVGQVIKSRLSGFYHEDS